MKTFSIAPDGEPTLTDQITEYLRHCRAGGLSTSTIERSYGYSLNKIFLPWLASAYPQITYLEEITPHVLDDFTADLLARQKRNGKPLSRASAGSYARNLNIFLKWAEQGVKAQTIKTPKRTVDVLTRDEVAKMESVATNDRDRLILSLLAETGTRAGGLVALTADSLQRHGNRYTLKVVEKGRDGGKERLVTIRPALWQKLDKYARHGRPRNASSSQIFLGLRCVGGEYPPLTVTGVLQVIKGLADRAGIQKRVYTHLFRHSYITWMVLQGVQEELIAAQVGHESMALIHGVYLHLRPNDDYGALIKALDP